MCQLFSSVWKTRIHVRYRHFYWSLHLSRQFRLQFTSYCIKTLAQLSLLTPKFQLHLPEARGQGHMNPPVRGATGKEKVTRIPVCPSRKQSIPLSCARSKAKTREQSPWHTRCVPMPWRGSGRSRDTAGAPGASWMCCWQAAAGRSTEQEHCSTWQTCTGKLGKADSISGVP